MSSISVAGDTSGSVTLSAPAVANTTVLTLPSVSGTLITSATGQTLTAPIINGMGSSVITSGTAVASTSGTSIDFTGIPSWAKRVTVMFSGVSTSGTSYLQFRLGTSGGVEATGYLSADFGVGGTTTSTALSTTGFQLRSDTASSVSNGQLVISQLNSATNLWVATGIDGRSDVAVFYSFGGSKTLAGVLDRVRITTVNGTDTFDAGSINILWE